MGPATRRLWVGGYPAPAGWDSATGSAWPVVLWDLAPELAEVSTPAWMRGAVEALTEWAYESGRAKAPIRVEVRGC